MNDKVDYDSINNKADITQVHYMRPMNSLKIGE